MRYLPQVLSEMAKRKRRSTIKCALLCSDLHVLSHYGLLLPGFKTEEGNEIGLNPLQEWMTEQYLSCIDEAIIRLDGDPCALILNGDLVEGNHHRTKEILHVDETEHARAAIHTLQPLLRPASKIYVVEGTETHTKQLESYIGKQIGAEKDPTTGQHMHRVLHIRINGCLGSVRHHMPTTSRTYLEASQLSIQLGNAQLTAVRSGYEPPKWIAAAHRHRLGVYTDNKGMMVVTPAWQGLTRFGRKVVPDGTMSVGFVFLDWRRKKPGELPEFHIIERVPDPSSRVVVEP